MTLSLLTPVRWRRFVLVLAVSSGASSVVALVETLRTGIDLHNRVAGLFSHYMTLSGWTMAALLILVGHALFGPKRSDRLWLAPVMAAHGIVLALSMTRNAWLGLATGLGLAAVVWRPRSLLALPLIAVMVLPLLPAQVRSRISSVADLTQHSNRDRLAMARSGLAMIADNPLTGVGPDRVAECYPHYRLPTAVRRAPSHLHSNPIQIAAEYGVPALVSWLAIVAAFAAAAWRGLRNQRPPPAPLVSVVMAVTGLMVAGLFEYNWGDAEIWILTLFVLAVPESRAAEAS